MDGFTDEQAQDDEQQMDLETEDFIATIDLGETPIGVDLFDFHRTNKGALAALRRATVTPRDRARKDILNGEDLHNHSRFFPRHLGNLMLVMLQQRCKDEDHPWSMVRSSTKTTRAWKSHRTTAVSTLAHAASLKSAWTLKFTSTSAPTALSST